MKICLCALLLFLSSQGTLISQVTAQDDDCETFKADLVFALDVSSSVGVDNFNLMVKFVRRIIESLKVGDDHVRVGLLTFSDDAHVVFRLEEHMTLAGVLNHMESIQFSKGKTHTEKALALLKDDLYSGSGNRPDVADVVVLITDGESTTPADTLAALESIRGENYTIFAIGIGDAKEEEINAISSDPDSFFSRRIEDFDLLVNMTSSFTESVCESLNPRVPPPKAAKNCGSFAADIVFVLDSSSSMTRADFNKMRGFVTRIVESVEIGDSATRVGLLKFSTEAHQEILLSDFDSKEDLIDRIKDVNFTGGLTYTNLALQLLPSVMFSNSNGNRPDVQDIVIVMTDGKSTNETATSQTLANIREQNYTIFALGISDGVKKEELDAIASDPDSRYSLQVDTFDDLQSLVDAFASQVCEEGIKPACGLPQADIIIVLDSSGSIKQHNFEKVKDFLFQIVMQFKVSPDEIRVGLLGFATDTNVEFYLDDYTSKAEVLSAIKNVRYTKGKTYTNKALKKLREEMLQGNGNRKDVKDIVIFLSDGRSTDASLTALEVEELKKTNFTVFAIGIGDNVDVDELNSISSDPDEFFTSLVDDFDALADIESTFGEKACNASDPKFKPPVIPPQANTTSLCSAPADVVIIMDASSSIGSSEYAKEKSFVKDLIGSFEIGPDDVRVGLVVFNSHAYVEFYLDTQQTKDQLVAAVNTVHGVSRGTYTHLALNVTRLDVLQESRGNRPGVQDVVILLTDGKSTQHSQTDVQATMLRNTGAIVLALGIGNGVDEAELKAIASDPDETYVQRAANFDALSGVLAQIVEVTCKATVTTIDPPLAKACGPFGDLVIMVDTSSSIGATRIGQVKHAIEEIVKKLDIDEDKIRVAVLTFDLVPKVLLDLEDGDSKDDVMKAVDAISQPGFGSWADRAFRTVRTEILQQRAGERPNAKDVILLFSDGVSRDSELAILEAEKLKENGAKVITVGTEGYKKTALRALSSAPSDDFSFTVENFDGIERIKDLLMDKSCDSAVQCGVEADIVVIMDASTSISKEEFMEMKEFAKHLLSGFEIGPDHVRVGVATYNYDAVMEFQLNSFSTKLQVLQAVDAVSGQGADTRTDKALKLVREVMFTEDNGNRPNVPDIAIVVTDGRSRNREKTIEEAIKLHKDGITVFAIGVGSRISEVELYAIATSPPDQFVYQVKDFQGLSAIETSLQRKTCGVPSTVHPDGMKLQADIMFVFDCSDQVLELNFAWALEFASQIVRSVRIGKKWTRFGAIKYSTDAVLEMTLDSYSTRADILTAIDQIERSGWESRVEKSLRLLRTLAFKDCLGGRPNVPDVAIIFTSGSFTHIDAAKYEAMLAINTGMKIFSVGIGRQVDKFQLEMLTNSPYSNTVFVGESREELHNIRAQLLHELDSVLNICY